MTTKHQAIESAAATGSNEFVALDAHALGMVAGGAVIHADFHFTKQIDVSSPAASL